MSDPAPNQDLPPVDVDVNVGGDPEVNNDLPEVDEPDSGKPPKDKSNRGKSEEAHANAPGQQKKNAEG